MQKEYTFDDLYEDLGTIIHSDGNESVNACLRIIKFMTETLEFMLNDQTDEDNED